MRRRTLLAVTGGTLLGSTAGCLGGDAGENGTISVDGTSVPLVSVADAIDWYEDDDLLVLDARSQREWEEVRIAGAEWSPAPDGRDNDPTAGVAGDGQVLTYCVCPHLLAGQRAASLIEAGFESVYALDEGLNEWIEQGYPLEGTEVTGSTASIDVREPDYHQ